MEKPEPGKRESGKVLKVALVGNPNSGKSTLFNALTGLNQRTGNFPGVTVDKKTGLVKIRNERNAVIREIEFIDLPGTYSLYPKSLDEKVSYEVLCDSNNEDYPDVTVVVADASNIKRNLFLVTQLIELRRPVILMLNMVDVMEKQGVRINRERLSALLGVPVVYSNAREKKGVSELKDLLASDIPVSDEKFFHEEPSPALYEAVRKIVPVESAYAAWQVLCNYDHFASFNPGVKQRLKALAAEYGFDETSFQARESVERFGEISTVVDKSVETLDLDHESRTHKIDRVLTHPFWGYLIFLAVLFTLFQAIFFLAAYPMGWIESFFVGISHWSSDHLPKGELSALLVNGILAGLSGVVVFVPQIALLFAFIAILEDTGYMARVSFIMDKLMRKFGLNGKSVIPLISGVACAVPAIMSTRTISNWKERMITILVTPLMSCSARLPVYTLLISLIVPSDKKFLFFNMQGLILMIMYLIGFMAALFSAWIMKFILKAREKSYFIMELPVYRVPKWSTVLYTIYEKVKVFLFDAGKVIVAISVILWVLSSHAPGKRFEEIDKKYENSKADNIEMRKASEKMEASYAGILGKTIEPVIRPLGYDWKIGIALVTSFAAREVFVGTMATIYSVGDQENTRSIREKMLSEKNPETGERVYSVAVGFSLMIFYAFAMQCMSTLAVVYRETKNWKWPFIQFLYMGILAYVCSFAVYHLFK
ncbi:MAG TPA: ferrous iron transport protein B [Bacteroidia bacterium]|jgi:ferrous iron transport protein B|nr:ferrous iron transport protein B [Bacteroidia bacterium]